MNIFHIKVVRYFFLGSNNLSLTRADLIVFLNSNTEAHEIVLPINAKDKLNKMIIFSVITFKEMVKRFCQ